MTSSDIQHIEKAFSQMRNKQDLLSLLNFAKTIVYGEKAVPFALKHLNYHSNPKVHKKRYKEFTIKKKSGDDRIIYAPTKGLKAIQKCLNLILQTVFNPNSAATGFVPGKSILDNAQVHSGSYYVYNIDLKDFFHSIDQARIWKCFQLKPFNLVEEDRPTLELGAGFQPGSGTFSTMNERLHFSIQKGGALRILRKERGDFSNAEVPLVYNSREKQSVLDKIRIKLVLEEFLKSTRRDLAAILASLCCTEIEVERKISDGVWEKQKRRVLPQGAPTSPVVTNIVCQRLDFLLSGVAKRFGLRYSRYADDITFSSLHNVYQKDSDFLKELHRIIQEQNFEIKDSKTRLQKEGYRQEVTGLVVNNAPNVPVRYIKQLRMWLYYWETYGYEKANDYFTSHYLADKGHIAKGKPNMSNVISGKLDFLKMVRGGENALYLKLRGRFDALARRSDSISDVLDIWETKGIDEAMELFYNDLSE
jgi:RNA-directed DNA polymerase